MDQFWNFANDHYLLIGLLAYVFIQATFQLISRIIRLIGIAIRGWPINPIMDADGDLVHKEEQEK